jgi:predicted ATPase
LIYLRELARRTGQAGTGYPFNAPVLSHLDALAFTQPVTILTGENGSGKTTLLELAAAGVRADTIGTGGNRARKTRTFVKAAQKYRFTFNQRPTRSFFFTAEDFTRYLDDRRAMQEEAREALREIDETYDSRSAMAKSLAQMPHMSTLSDLDGQYERELLEASHGEGFLSFFAGRLIPNGLYLLDEPEGALSFANQLGLLALIDQAAGMNCQVILATHSPVLCAYPGAQLIDIDDGALQVASYDTLAGIRFIKYFLANRAGVLRQAGIEGLPNGL